MICAKCKTETPNEFTVGGKVPAGSKILTLDDEAIFHCPLCDNDEKWGFVPALKTVVFDHLNAPDNCPTCGKRIEAHEFYITLDIDTGTIEIWGFTILCPHCHDDIGNMYAFQLPYMAVHVLMNAEYVPPQRCRVCGCTNDNACLDDDGEPCAWVEGEDLCTRCMSEQVRQQMAQEEAERGVADPRGGE